MRFQNALEEHVVNLVARGVGLNCLRRGLLSHFQQQFGSRVKLHKHTIRQAVATAVQVWVSWDAAQIQALNPKPETPKSCNPKPFK